MVKSGDCLGGGLDGFLCFTGEKHCAFTGLGLCGDDG